MARAILAIVALAASSAYGQDDALFAPFEAKPVAGIDFSGHRVTREFVITRELETKVGEPLDLHTLRQDLVRLENLGVFADTRVVPAPDGEGVRLGFEFREMPPVIVYPSFSYTEENGFSYGPALSTLNLAGRGIRLSAKVFFGGASQRFARLTWPWITGNHVSLDFNGGRVERDDTLNGFREKSWEFTPWLGTFLGKHGRLRGSASFFRMNSDVAGKTLDPDNEDRFFRVAGALGWDTRDSWRDPRRGWLNEIEVWHTSGDGSFWTANVDVRRYQPVAPRQHVLLSGLLTLQSGEVGRDVPGYLTYYLGGANSVRGYNVEELGPVLNGKNQLLATTEYNFSLLEVRRRDFWRWSFGIGLQLTAFGDLGLAWSTPEELRVGPLPRRRRRRAADPGAGRGAGAARRRLEPRRRRCTSTSRAAPSPPASAAGHGEAAARRASPPLLDADDHRLGVGDLDLVAHRDALEVLRVLDLEHHGALVGRQHGDRRHLLVDGLHLDGDRLLAGGRGSRARARATHDLRLAGPRGRSRRLPGLADLVHDGLVVLEAHGVADLQLVEPLHLRPGVDRLHRPVLGVLQGEEASGLVDRLDPGVDLDGLAVGDHLLCVSAGGQRGAQREYGDRPDHGQHLLFIRIRARSLFRPEPSVNLGRPGAPDLWDQGPMDQAFRAAQDPRVNQRAAAFLMIGLLAGCAPKGTKLVTSWREPSATPTQFQKVLVLFFAPHESQRQFGESELVRLMTRTRGVAAYTVLPPADLKDVEKVKAAMAREGFDGALAMRFVEATQQLSQDAAYAPSYAAFWDYYDVAWPLINDPGYVRMDRAMQMETRVYSMKDGGKLLWSGLSQTMNPGSAQEFVAQVASTVAADLRKQRVIE